MRARRREINIFNMSLLDILCGALGAFCFMMIVALPYYVPPGKSRDLRKAQEETEKLMRDLEKMKERMPDQKSGAEMEEMLQRLEAQLKALQGQVNILTAQNEDLKARVEKLSADYADLLGEANELQADKLLLQDAKQKLTEENANLKARLLARKAFTIMARADDSGQGVDVLLFKSSQLEKSPNPVFENWVKGDYDNMHTMRNAMLFGRGIGVSVNEDSPPGSQGKLFVRLTNPPERRKATEVEGAIVGDELLTAPIRLPKVTLYPERFWILLGTLSIDQNSQSQFKEATEEERAAAWKTLTGSAEPSTPTPTPTPSDAERAAAQAVRSKRQELNKKFGELMRLPYRDGGENDAAILQLANELLQQLPPNDSMRREVLARRTQVLDRQAHRSGPTPAPSASPRGPFLAPSPR